jgi:phosphoribosylglycinamide formyltransferase 1
MIRIAVLVSGRGSNLQALLDACREGRVDGQVVAVVSDKADAYGLERARQAAVEAIFFDPAAFASRNAYDAALADILKALDVDLVVLAGYMRLVKKPFLDAFAGRVINVHPALLPAFKGLDAQRQALEYGAKVAGATVHFVTLGMDEGPIILQTAVPVLDDDTVETLSARILEQEHRILPEAVQLFSLGKLTLEGRRVIVQ